MPPPLGIRSSGLGFIVPIRVEGSGFRIQGFGFLLGFRVEGVAFRV